MILAQRRFSFDLDFNNPRTPRRAARDHRRASGFNGGQDYHRHEPQCWESKRRAGACGDAERARRRRGGATTPCWRHPSRSMRPRAVTAVDSGLKQARARFESGAALKSDVLSLEVSRRGARSGGAGTERRRAVTYGAATLLALPPDASMAVAPREEGNGVDAAREILRRAARRLSKRPELTPRRARLRFASMNWTPRAARFYRASTWWGTTATTRQLRALTTPDNWAVGVTAELDLFSGFRHPERVRASEHRLKEAQQAERALGWRSNAT